MIPQSNTVTQLTTAGTDALVAASVLGGAAWLRHSAPASAVRRLWVAALAILGCAALTGGTLHAASGYGWSVGALWRPVYAAIGLAFALILVATVGVCRAGATARKLLTPVVLLWALYFAMTWRTASDEAVLRPFGLATIGSAIVLLGSLGSLGTAGQRRRPGAATAAGGMLLLVVAAVSQASEPRVSLAGLTLDHNSIAHLITIAAIATLLRGVRDLSFPERPAHQ